MSVSMLFVWSNKTEQVGLEKHEHWDKYVSTETEQMVNLKWQDDMMQDDKKTQKT